MSRINGWNVSCNSKGLPKSVSTWHGFEYNSNGKILTFGLLGTQSVTHRKYEPEPSYSGQSSKILEALSELETKAKESEPIDKEALVPRLSEEEVLQHSLQIEGG